MTLISEHARDVLVYAKKPDETGRCTWCDQAKDWLTEQNIPFKVIELEAPERRALYDDLKLEEPMRTVPQVMIRDCEGIKHRIGGFKELTSSGIESLFS